MPDWMDDLLSSLPSEPQPEGLPFLVRARLVAERRRERWSRLARQVVLLGAAALGAWLVAPYLPGLEGVVPQVSVEALREWTGMLLSSPAAALRMVLDGVVGWAFGVEEHLGPALILALVLIAVPALSAAAGLVRDVQKREEGLA
ncbi:MAG: hypothetical protein A2Z66_04960 [Chloroflexi bacterium RBG_13_66_10]|jgi:hypothetical protein|nr:MAG: hypothetical protein A2Z66_04960 [Chloroflexi bacterium RBG_13_66_10]